MSYQIEYEERNMLSKEEYEILFSYYSNFANPISLENYYFDTPLFEIRKSHSNLRVRKINNQAFEMTLKIKGENGDEEFTSSMSKDEFEDLRKTGCINQKEIISALAHKNISNSFVTLWGYVKVLRLEIKDEDSLIVIDHNCFGDIEDYNLEIESSSKELAKNKLMKICNNFKISIKENYSTKSSRAFHYFVK